jgi:RNA polymerase sigma factor (sigma-70 family)
MLTSPLQGVIHYARRAALVSDEAGLTDGQLLSCFIERQDEGAFEALVRRHGPMVLGVCRRVLHGHHDVEDAFQATFLVLVRKAASIVPREMVANWLYGVAHTTAIRARGLSARRRVREKQVIVMPEPEAVRQELWDDLQGVLDLELSRLPDKYRVAIVLCDLQEKSHKEAARQLGWPIGTLSGRLARARKMLAVRLARHGLAVSGSALVGVLSGNAASASLPGSLVSSTVKAASVLAAGQAAIAGSISAQVAALTEGVVMTMNLNKIKTVTMVLLFAALLSGAGLFYHRTQAAEPARDTPVALAAETEDETPPSDKQDNPHATRPSSESKVPGSALPRQALVRLEKGQLVVRTRDIMYEPKTVFVPAGKNPSYSYSSYDLAEITRTRHYDLDTVKVFDVKGKSVGKKDLTALLKHDVIALVSHETHAVDPLNLRLFKDGTLLFVLPPSVLYPAPAVGVTPPAPAVIPPPPAPTAPLPVPAVRRGTKP